MERAVPVDKRWNNIIYGPYERGEKGNVPLVNGLANDLWYLPTFMRKCFKSYLRSLTNMFDDGQQIMNVLQKFEGFA